MVKYSNSISKAVDDRGLDDSDDLAYLTHYLQNLGGTETLNFQESAFRVLYDNPDLKKSVLNGTDFVGNDFGSMLLNLKFDVPFAPPEKPSFKFIDLFAGIGGFRLALQSLNGQCVFSSEIDKYCKRTYSANFGEVPFGDIKNFTDDKNSDNDLKKNIPDHDILAAGFPCQAFSIAGKRGGFKDTRGTLFFDIARILKAKKPKAFILENVKGLRSHKSGKTLETILKVLREDLEYYVPDPQILNAKKFGLPQNRERILIVGFRKDLDIKNFEYPNTHIQGSKFATGRSFNDVKEKKEVSPRYYLSDVYLNTLEEHRKRHEDKGNGFGYQIIDDQDTANAIVVGGMGRERNLVLDERLTNFTPVTNIKGEINKQGIRKMTPREWARLQGFPDNYIINKVSNTQNYKQFGNSVPVSVIEAVGNKVVKLLEVNT